MFVLFVLLFIIDIILFEFISFFFPILSANLELYSLLIVITHGISILVCLICKGDSYKHIFIAAFILRLAIMFIDLYHVFPVLHSGGDTEMFHYFAVYSQTHPNEFVITNYTLFLSNLYSWTHCSRILAQYVNVLFGLGILFILKRIFESYRMNSQTINLSLSIIAFTPNIIIFSGILLREAWIEFFVILSLYYFLNWFKTCNHTSSIITILCVLLAAYMHDGTIVLLVGYLFAFITYNTKTQKIEISQQSVLAIFILTVVVTPFLGHLSIFTAHFNNIESAEILTTQINSKLEGGSSYLSWIHSDNVFMSLLFAPLKMFYFLYSPLPTNWRGLGDIVAFIIDSCIYIYLSWTIYSNYVYNKTIKLLRKYLLVSLLTTIFVFSYGTATAGTAMRHRAKVLPVIVVIYAFSINEKYKSDNNAKGIF